MNKNIKCKIILTVLFICGMLLIFSGNVRAANVSISTTEAKVGSQMTITVNGTGAQWDLKLKVNRTRNKKKFKFR